MPSIVTEMLTHTDIKRHIPHVFHVPANAHRLTIRLRFSPLKGGTVRNMLTLTLFDPNGFRGAGHRGGDLHEVVIEAEGATPGYLPGPLPAGDWIVQIDTHMIGPDAPCTYELSVDVATEEGTVPAASTMSAAASTGSPPAFDVVARNGPGWYRGDLHTHTRHSDGSWDVADLVATARTHNLDFIALTDHNTISPLAEMASHTNPELLTLGGMELTTFWGHAVCLGSTAWIDWRVDAAGRGMAAIAEAIHADDGIFIIAHPKSIGDPYCTGCRWVYPEMMPGAARCVEIWNGPWHSRRGSVTVNEEGLALWYGWLNQGYRIVATAGSDTHGSDNYERPLGFSVIYAEELSQPALLRAICAGHLYLSSGPTLHFHAQIGNGHQAMMGDTLFITANQADLTLCAEWTNTPDGSQLRLIENGDVYAQQRVAIRGEVQWSLPVQSGRWYVLELRSNDGQMLAVTNPIDLR